MTFETPRQSNENGPSCAPRDSEVKPHGYTIKTPGGAFSFVSPNASAGEREWNRQNLTSLPKLQKGD